MAARALSFGIPVMNGKGQSDDHDDQNDEFIVAHTITPFGNKEGQSQAPSVSFLPGAMLRHYFNIYVFVTSMSKVPPPRRDRHFRHPVSRPRDDVRPRMQNGKAVVHQRHAVVAQGCFGEVKALAQLRIDDDAAREVRYLQYLRADGQHRVPRALDGQARGAFVRAGVGNGM